MSQIASQVLQRLLHMAHAAVSIALGIAVVITVSTGALVWRLSQGPVDLAWLTPRLQAALSANRTDRLHIDSVALAWEGWRGGVDRPLDLRLRGITTTDDRGTTLVRIPQVALSLSFGWLLLGRLVPRAIEIDRANIELLRASDGTLSLGIGDQPVNPDSEPTSLYIPLVDVLSEIMQPRQHDRATVNIARPRWTELRRIRVAHANLTLIDHLLATVWRSPDLNVDLRRAREGGMTGTAGLTMMLADRAVQLQIGASFRTGEGPRLQVQFTPIELDALARALPQLKLLSLVHGSASGTVGIGFGTGLDWRECAVQAELGEGTVRLGDSSVPIVGAMLNLTASPTEAELRSLRVTLAGPSGIAPIITLQGKAERRNERVIGSLQADLDQVQMSDLSRLWPAGIANGARAWVIRNVTTGTARAAHAVLAFQSAADGSDAVITNATGKVSADDLTIHWLRPLPPIEHVKADLTVISPDSLIVKAEAGRLAGTGPGAILVRGGSFKVTGMMEKDQFGAIDVNLASSLTEVLSLLRQPRLRLLDRHPLELRNPSGQVAARVGLNLWLDDRVTFDSIPIHASAELHNVHLADVLGGRDLSDGELSLRVDNDGMQLDGGGAIGGVPAAFGVQMDFRAGPATETRIRYKVSGSVRAEELTRFGVDPGSVAQGPVNIQATVLEKRDGTGEADIQADLRQADLSIAPLGWHKRDGQPAKGIAHVTLDHDHIVGIDRLVLDGEALAVDASVRFIRNQPALVRVNRAVLGNTSGTGEIRLATAPGAPIRINLSGSSIDLTGRFNQLGTAGHHGSSIVSPWVADLKFNRVVLGEHRVLLNVVAQVRHTGTALQEARIAGRLDEAGEFTLSITPEAGDLRRVVAESSNAGSFLRALNVISSVDGGRLVLAAKYDDAAAGDPLSGSVEIVSFRLRDAPAATRVLEAMTLYGLATALRGRGLEISRLVAPFRLVRSTLELTDSRAFSPSLGFTAKGRIDLEQRTADIDGTIVPAYFFNSLLGRIPLIGNLFSPERGGGMFAATYRVRGRLDSPAVTVNPLAALTPGFLRGLFGVFQGSGVRTRSGS